MIVPSVLFFWGFFAFLHWISFVVVVLDRFFFFFIWDSVVAGQIRQVVVLYSNNWIGICLGRLSIGHFTEMVVCNALS